MVSAKCPTLPPCDISTRDQVSTSYFNKPITSINSSSIRVENTKGETVIQYNKKFTFDDSIGGNVRSNWFYYHEPIKKIEPNPGDKLKFILQDEDADGNNFGSPLVFEVTVVKERSQFIRFLLGKFPKFR
jgi:hypothetical protein